MPAEISLRDVAVATAELGIDAGTPAYDRLLQALGYRAEAPYAVDPAPRPDPEPPTPTPPSEPPDADPVSTLDHERVTPPTRRASTAAATYRIDPAQVLDDLRASAAVPPSFPSPRPLVPRRLLAGLLPHVVGARTAGALDVDAVVALVSTGTPITAVPRLARPTLGRGVQLLVDRSAGMEPFADDVTDLVDRLRSLVGEPAVDEVECFDVPDRASELDPWSPPAPGTPVLAITDLDTAERSGQSVAHTVRRWTEVDDLLRTQGSALRILTPYPPERWPAGSEHLTLVPWDPDALRRFR